ncbi:hypothetical protein KKB55_15840 [Myxococcota bacterium]|nr:hypothetical protein [Myxococcota bacterium]
MVYLAWTPDLAFSTVRVLRRADRLPTHGADGTVVYEGRAVDVIDGPLADGRYYYALFSVQGGVTGPALDLGVAAVGTPVRAENVPGFFAAASRPLNRALILDNDSDASFRALEIAGGQLQLDLLGHARSGQTDGARLFVEEPITEPFYFTTTYTLPHRLDQSWSMLTDLRGSGSVWFAFYMDMMRVSLPGLGWVTVASNLTPGQVIDVAVAVDPYERTVEFFINGVRTLSAIDDLTELNEIRLLNYGYATVDLRYEVSNVGVFMGRPPFAPPRPVTPPVNFVAFGSAGKVFMATTPAADTPQVRVVRRSDRYPNAADDGDVVFQGSSTSFSDSPGLGTFYYSAFGVIDDRFSLGVNAGTTGTVVRPDGQMIFNTAQNTTQIRQVVLRDGDKDAQLKVDLVGNEMVLSLDELSTNGERDWVEVFFNEPISGDLFTIDYTFQIPTRVDQSWSLLLEPVGSGGLWTAFIDHRFMANIPVRGWTEIARDLEPGQRVRITQIVDPFTDNVTFYVDQQRVGTYQATLQSLDRVRFEHYGYARRPLTYRVSNFAAYLGTPDFYQPIAPAAPLNVAAIPGAGQVALAWVPAPDAPNVRVLRKAGGFSANPEDGEVVYQGTRTEFIDSGLAVGRYYYSVYSMGTAFSDSIQIDAANNGTEVRADGLDGFFSSPSSSIKRIWLYDRDSNTSFKAYHNNNDLVLDLQGEAVNGENDYIRFEMNEPPGGYFTIEWQVTTPDRLDQSWSLLINPTGSGNLWGAFYLDSFRLNLPSVGWRDIATDLQTNTNYTFTFVVDANSQLVTTYVDGVFTGEHLDDLRRLDNIYLYNYGYAVRDMTWRLRNLSVRPGVPDYHQLPQPEAPHSVLAVPGEGGVMLSWVPAESTPIVRVVRKANGYPAHEADGVVVYEGRDMERIDPVAAGRYYYTAFGTKGLDFARKDFGEGGLALPAVGAGGLMADASEVPNRVFFRDGDRNGTIQPYNRDRAVDLLLKGEARSGEYDHFEVRFAEQFNALATWTFTFRTPNRLDQSWNLRMDLVGSSSLVSAVELDRLRASIPGLGWQTIRDDLLPDTEYTLTYVLDLTRNAFTVYEGQVELARHPMSLARLDALRVAHYGYSIDDVTWQLKDIKVEAGAPAFYQPPVLGGPINGFATLGDGRALLTWTSDPEARVVRVVRKAGAFPADANDGDIIYEGTGLYLENTPPVPGAYCYTVFSKAGLEFSDGLNLHPAPLNIQPSALPSFMANGADILTRAYLIDSDRDVTFKATPTDEGKLALDLLAPATNGEYDRLELYTDVKYQGQFTIELEVTTPANLMQSWNFSFEPIGSGAMRVASYFDTLRVLQPQAGWADLIALQPSTAYQLVFVVDSARHVVSAYHGDVKLGDFRTDMLRLDRFRFANYGYGDRDVRWLVDDLRAYAGAPAFHVVPDLAPPANALAMAGEGAVLVSWTPAPGNDSVILSRRFVPVAGAPVDWSVIYEGNATAFVDESLGDGDYFYQIRSVGPSAPLDINGGQAVTLDARARPPYFGDAGRGPDYMYIYDLDRDATIKGRPEANHLTLELAGEAASDERDFIEVRPTGRLEGVFSVRTRIKMPARIDQSWGLLIQPSGVGDLWYAFYQDQLRANLPGRGWTDIATGLAPNQVIDVVAVSDGENNSAAFYVDGVEKLRGSESFSELQRLRFYNYGYALADLTYEIDQIEMFSGTPDYYVDPGVVEPVNAIAMGNGAGVLLAWTPSPVHERVMVRRADAPLNGPDDGVLVYEGVDHDFFDAHAGGHYGLWGYRNSGPIPTRSSAGFVRLSALANDGPMAATSVPARRLQLIDGDASASFLARQVNQGLNLNLIGDARNGERDRMTVQLARGLTGMVAIDYHVTLPARLDNSWSLLAQAYGTGELWAAFRNTYLFVNIGGVGWVELARDLQAGQTYRVTYVVNTSTRLISAYLDGQLLRHFSDNLDMVGNLSFENYGYNYVDLPYRVTGVSVSNDIPDFYEAPVVEPPRLSYAIPAPNAALIAWVPSPNNSRVRLVHNANHAPANMDDGEVVYEGAATAYRHEGLAAGDHFYTLFGMVGDAWSGGAQVTGSPVAVAPDARPTWMGAGVAPFGLSLRDVDQNTSLRPTTVGNQLNLEMAAEAVNGERDWAQINLAERMSGQVTFAFNFTVPDRVDQRWTLRADVAGAGEFFAAVDRDAFFAYDTVLGWRPILEDLVPGARHHVDFILETDKGLAAALIDGVQVGPWASNLTRADALRFNNYGYGDRAVDWRVDGVRIYAGAPAGYQPAEIGAPINTFGAIGQGDHLLTWVPDPATPRVRVVRKAAGYPANAADGEIIYEGTATWCVDDQPTPTAFYAVFGVAGDEVGGVGARIGPLRVADGNAYTRAGSIPLGRVNHYDADKDGTMVFNAEGGLLHADLAAEATNGESDGLQLFYRQILTGRFQLGFKVRTPPRLDQSWSLIVEPAGSGNIWTAFNAQRLYMNVPNRGWVIVRDDLAPDTEYDFTYVIDTDRRAVTFYEGDQQLIELPANLYRFDRLNLRNYGYTTEPLRYTLRDLYLSATPPAFDLPPAIAPPVAALAVGDDSAVRLAWVAAPSTNTVRIVRVDGDEETLLYEGLGVQLSYPVDAPGAYSFRAYGVVNGIRSPALNLGGGAAGRPIDVLAAGRPPFFINTGVSRINPRDADRDGTLQTWIEPVGQDQVLQILTKGDATDDERDWMDLELSSRPEGDLFAIQFKIHTPARLDQEWGLLMEWVGAGGIWAAFEQDRLRVSAPDQGWLTVADGLMPNQSYDIAFIVDGSTGLVSAYLDGVLTRRFTDDLRRLDRLRLENYGYNEVDQLWGLSHVSISDQLPAFYSPPLPAQPVNFVGVTGGDDRVLLAWTGAAEAPAVRLVRNPARAPQNPNDGVVLYEGGDSEFIDTGVAEGAAHYALFGASAGQLSEGVAVNGTGDVIHRADGQPPFATGAPPLRLRQANLYDVDRNGTLRVSERDGALALITRGEATNNERDRLRLYLENQRAALFTFSFDLTMPARLDQSWGLFINPIGAGSVWTAIYTDSLRASVPVTGWVDIATGLVPGQTYHLDYVVDPTSGLVYYYVDQAAAGVWRHGLSRMERLEIGNYGYAAFDQTWGLDNIAVTEGAPDYHVVPPLAPVVNAMAMPGDGQVHLAWTRTPSQTGARVVRHNQPIEAEGVGQIVYEGDALRFTDAAPLGTWHYAVFSLTGDQLGAPLQVSPVRVRADGVDGFRPASTLLSHIELIDRDLDGTLTGAWAGDQLRLALAAEATNEERDGVRLKLAQTMAGAFVVELDLTTPARLDQSWSQAIELSGAGQIWTAVYTDAYRINAPGLGWRDLIPAMQPNHTYRLSFIINTTLDLLSIYVDGQEAMVLNSPVENISQLGLYNYGYNVEPQTWGIDDIFVSTALPAFYQPPGFEPPVSGLALGGQGRALLTWVPTPGADNVKIIRSADHSPQNINDGVEVYEGAATDFADVGLAAGVWYYAAFAYAGGVASAPFHFGAEGTEIKAAGYPDFFSGEGLSVTRITARDPNASAGLRAQEAANALALDLAGASDNGERDWIELHLDGRLNGLFTLEFTVEMPARLDQSWSLLLEAYGTGNLWAAFRQDTFQINLPGVGWRALAEGLRAGAQHHFVLVVNGDTHTVTSFVDGQQTAVVVDDLSELTRLRFEDYGYALEDLRFAISGFSARAGAPDNYVAPVVAPPITAVAVGDVNRVYLAWTTQPGSDRVRVVRKEAGVPQNINDGVVILDNLGAQLRDEGLAAGRYHYAIFASTDGLIWSDGFPLPDVVVGQAPRLLRANSAQLETLSLRDGDRDGTFAPTYDGQALSARLLGEATNGELDHLQLNFSSAYEGWATARVKIHTPARLDQDWNATFEVTGSSNQRVSIQFDRLRALTDGGSWQDLAVLAPDTDYDLTLVFDMGAKIAAYYVDEQLVGRHQSALTRAANIQLRNYGYGERDQTVVFSDIELSDQIPAFFSPPPADGPVNAVALGGDGGALLAWTLPAGVDHAVVLRNAARYPADINDGDVVYEGAELSFFDPVAPGRYYYGIFTRVGERTSPVVPCGTQGVEVAADGRPEGFTAASISFDRLRLGDADRDATIQLDPSAGGLAVTLAAEALDNERDYAELRLSQSLAGQLYAEWVQSVPDRLDQSWSLVIELVGAGNVWMAVQGERFYYLEPGAGWRPVVERLQPGTTPRLGFTVDTAQRTISFYVERQRVVTYTTNLERAERLRFYNYGYANEALRYQLNEIELGIGLPAWHQPILLEPALTGIAIDAVGGAALTWLPRDGLPQIRVVRSADHAPAAADDGDVIYEGAATQILDPAAPGVYHYAAFSMDAEGRFSAPLALTPAGGLDVTAAGLPSFFGAGSIGVSGARLYDSDKDISLQASYTAEGDLALWMGGAAADNERDFLELQLAQSVSGQLYMQYTYTLPRRDQSWSLLIQALGDGDLWLSFDHALHRLSAPAQGWVTLVNHEGAPDGPVVMTHVIDTDTGAVSIYKDGAPVTTLVDNLARLDRIRLQNYGYADVDMTWIIKDLVIREGVPAFHQPPQLQPPVNGFAVGGAGQVALAWTPPPGIAQIRVVRNPDRVPNDENDGANVYEGVELSFIDAVGAAGDYHYALFSALNGQYSDGYALANVTVQPDGRPTFGVDSSATINAVRLSDGDSDATFKARANANGALTLELAGAAESSEQDFLELELDQGHTGWFHYSYKLTMPDRVNNDWSLVVEAAGTGNAWTAFRQTSWQVYVPATGWVSLVDNLQANTTYLFQHVVDGETGTLSFYVDGQHVGSIDDDLRAFNLLRLRNYGYANDDLSYVFDDLQIGDGVPNWHQIGALDPPAGLFHTGGRGEMLLAWTPLLTAPTVRVVRHGTRPPRDANDGHVVYEGAAINGVDDQLAAGESAYYAVFSKIGDNFSDPTHASTSPSVLLGDGVPSFFRGASLGLAEVSLFDADRDGSLKAYEHEGALHLDLDAAAANEERDRLDLVLSSTQVGQVSVSMELTTPARVDQNWSLIIQLAGRGDVFTAIYQGSLRVCHDTACWADLYTELQANTTYRLNYVVNTETQAARLYIDGVQAGAAWTDDLTRLDQIRFYNYGYAAEDLGYIIDNMAVRNGDVDPPVFVVPAETVVAQQDCAGAVVRVELPAVNDETDPSPDLTYTIGADTFDAAGEHRFPLGKTRVTWDATDFSGNTQRQFQIINVVDQSAPQLQIPAMITVEATSPAGTPVALDDLNAVDPVCANDVEIAHNGPARFPLGDTQVTVTATDAADNQDEQILVVRVVDTTPPAAELPAEIQLFANQCAGADAPIPSPVYSDNGTALGALQVSVTVGGDTFALADVPNTYLFPVGQTALSWTITDAAGNRTTRQATVTVPAVARPSLDYQDPPSGWINGDGEVVVTVSNLCDGGAVSILPPPANGVQQDGDTYTAQYGGEGEHEIVVRIDRPGAAPIEDRSVLFAIDEGAPRATFRNVPAQPDPNDPLETWPVLFQGERMEPRGEATDDFNADPVPLDAAPSGIARFEMLINPGAGQRVLLDAAFDAVGLPPRGPDQVKRQFCDNANICDLTELLGARLPLGAQLLRINATDYAGNVGVEEARFAVLDLTGGLERALGEIEVIIADGATPAIALGPLNNVKALLEQAISQSELDLVGNVIIALQFAEVQYADIELVGVDASSPRLFAIRALLARLRMERDEAVLPAEHAAAMDDRITQAQADYDNADAASALLSINDGWFYLEDARLPWPDLGADVANRLIGDLNDYIALAPDALGVPEVTVVRDALTDIRGLIDAPIDDLQAMRLLLELEALTRSLFAVEDQGVWVRNWQFALVRIIRIRVDVAVNRLNFFGENLGEVVEAWRRFEVGLALVEARRFDAALRLFLENECFMVETFAVIITEATGQVLPNDEIPAHCQP